MGAAVCYTQQRCLVFTSLVLCDRQLDLSPPDERRPTPAYFRYGLWLVGADGGGLLAEEREGGGALIEMMSDVIA